MNALTTRRSLLIMGVTAGGALTLGASYRWMGATAPGALLLSQLELDVVEAAAAVLFPPGLFPSAGGDGKTAPEVDRLVAEVLDPPTVAPFRAMLGALEWGTLISRGTRFSAMELSEAKACGQKPDAAAIHAYASARFTPDAVGGAIEAVYRSLV